MPQSFMSPSCPKLHAHLQMKKKVPNANHQHIICIKGLHIENSHKPLIFTVFMLKIDQVCNIPTAAPIRTKILVLFSNHCKEEGD